MPLASTRRSVPSGRNDTTAAEYSDVPAAWSEGAEMPNQNRPSGARAMPLTSPRPAGRLTTVRALEKEVPSKPEYAATPPFELT